jgi:hypothetical protein
MFRASAAVPRVAGRTGGGSPPQASPPPPALGWGQSSQPQNLIQPTRFSPLGFSYVLNRLAKLYARPPSHPQELLGQIPYSLENSCDFPRPHAFARGPLPCSSRCGSREFQSPARLRNARVFLIARLVGGIFTRHRPTSCPIALYCRMACTRLRVRSLCPKRVSS